MTSEHHSLIPEDMDLAQPNPKHALIPILRARGFTLQRIADVVGISANRVCIVLRRPEMQALVRELQRSIAGTVLHATVARIMDEAEPSIDRLVDLRDHSDEDKIKLDAAKSLLFDAFLDRALPKKTAVDIQNQPPAQHLPQADFSRFSAALEEAGLAEGLEPEGEPEGGQEPETQEPEPLEVQETQEPSPEPEDENHTTASPRPRPKAKTNGSGANGAAPASANSSAKPRKKLKRKRQKMVSPSELKQELGSEGAPDTFEF